MFSQFSDVVLWDSIAPLLGIALLMLTGLALIVSSSRERAKMMAKRIDKVQWAAGSVEGKSGGKRRRSGERVNAEPGGDLSDAEHRQIIRSYARFGAAPEAALGYYRMTRLFLLAVLAVLPLPFLGALFAKSMAVGLLAMAFPAAIGWFLPPIIIRRGVVRRSRNVSAGLPDALELLAVCIEAGLSLENGLQRVSGELKRSLPDLADELALTWAEINILPDRDQALANFAERVNVPSVRTVVTTLSQTLRYGTPLARSLRVVAADVRADQLTAMEEKANRLPALMTIPVMLFIMPTIFLIIGGPAALKLMDIFFK